MTTKTPTKTKRSPAKQADAKPEGVTGQMISFKDQKPEKGRFILAKGPELKQNTTGTEFDVCLWDGMRLWSEQGTANYGHEAELWMYL